MEISGKGELGQAGGSAFSYGLSATDGEASGIFSNFSMLLTLLAGDSVESDKESPLENLEKGALEAKADGEVLSNASPMESSCVDPRIRCLPRPSERTARLWPPETRSVRIGNSVLASSDFFCCSAMASSTFAGIVPGSGNGFFRGMRVIIACASMW